MINKHSSSSNKHKEQVFARYAHGETIITDRFLYTEYVNKYRGTLKSKMLVECLIATRLLVLKTLRERFPNLKFFEWLCIQRSRRSRNLFFEIFTELSQLPWSVSSMIYDQLKKTFLEDGGRVIFDESQHMLELLKLDYHSTKSHQQHIKDGRFAFPRSFFSFLSKFIFKTGKVFTFHIFYYYPNNNLWFFRRNSCLRPKWEKNNKG